MALFDARHRLFLTPASSRGWMALAVSLLVASMFALSAMWAPLRAAQTQSSESCHDQLAAHTPLSLSPDAAPGLAVDLEDESDDEDLVGDASAALPMGTRASLIARVAPQTWPTLERRDTLERPPRG